MDIKKLIKEEIENTMDVYYPIKNKNIGHGCTLNVYKRGLYTVITIKDIDEDEISISKDQLEKIYNLIKEKNI